MKLFTERLRKLATREEGATMVEYGLMVALIAVVCLVAVGALGGGINEVFENITAQLGGGDGG